MTPAAGYTPDEPRRGVPMISMAELRQMFSLASEDDLRAIGESLSKYTYDALNARIQGDVRDDRKIRILEAGADVTSTAAGTQVKYPGESYADVLDFRNASVDVESVTFGRKFNIRTTGGADCMFDYLVSACWATEVAAGRGTEGQEFASLSGCTFSLYSTVQGAVTAARDEAGADTTRVIYICPGTYVEAINAGGTALGNQFVRLVGAGRDRVIIGGATSSDETFDCNGSGQFWVSGITWKPSSANDAFFLQANDVLIAWDCEFQGTSSSRYGLTTGSSLSTNVKVTECVFTGTHGLQNNTGDCWVVNNHFQCTTISIEADENTYIEANDFKDSGTSISIVNGSENIMVRQNRVNKTTGTFLLLNGTQHNYHWYVDNQFGTDTGGPSTCFDMSSATSGLSDTWVIKGNTGTMGNAGTFLKLPTTFSQSNAFNMFVRIQDNDIWTQALNGTFVTGQYDHPIVTMSGNFLNHQPVEGVSAQGFTGKIWYFSQEKPMTIGVIAHTERFGDTVVSVAAQTASLSPGTNYIEVNSSGTLSSNLTAFTAGSMPILKVVCADDGSGNAVYTSHIDTAGILYVQNASGGGVPAAASEPFVTIGNSANLSAERALVGGSGIDLTDGGANATLDLAALTQLWDQSGAYNIVQRGGDLLIANSKDLKLYSDNSATPSTMVGEWDGATGHIGIPTVSAIVGLNFAKSLANANARGISVELTGTTAGTGALAALGFTVITAGTAAGTQLIATGMYGEASHRSERPVTTLAGLYSVIGSTAAGTGAIATAAALYVPAASWAGDVPAITALLYGSDVGGTGATAYGLYLPAQTGGAARSFIADGLALGTNQAVPSGSKAIVDGAITLDEVTAPGTPAGDELAIYNETNTDLLKVKNDAGSVMALNASRTVSITVETPTASEDLPIMVFPWAVTIDAAYSFIRGGTSVTFNLAHGTNPTSTANVFTSGQTANTSTSVQTHNSGFSDNTLAAGEALKLTSSALSGTVNALEITVEYRIT